jgi:hypothetical protein
MEVAKTNQIALMQNIRLSSVLQESTGEPARTSVDDWWQWWYDDNECLPPERKPARFAYSSIAINQSTPSKVPILDFEFPKIPSGLMCECLAAGTPVWTESGPVAVEKIIMGDRVFACDPETGCLALKVVLKTTIRPPTTLLKIRIGGEVIESTGGHTFWVSGRGWIKARELKPEMNVRTIRGPAEVESIEKVNQQPAFNLVVDDFHSYYVGRGKYLTHDNTIRKPTDRVVPGLAAAR